MRIARRSVLLLALAALLTVSLRPAAADASPFTNFIGQLGNEALALLQREDLSQSEREHEVRRLLRTGFAVFPLARFVMGRYWQQLDQAQRDTYVALFEDYIVKTYASKLSLYSSVAFQVQGERADGSDGAIVTTEVRTPDGTPLRVQWRLRLVHGEPKIVDVLIEGVSMALTQQNEFASVIRAEGGDIRALIEQLRRKVDALD